MPLTDVQIKKLEPRETEYLVCDFDCLYISIRPSGTKAWVYRPRTKGQKKKVLGQWPSMSVKEARQARDEYAARHAGQCFPDVTFREMANEWFKHKALPVFKPKTLHLIQQRLNDYLFPAFGDLDINDVTPSMLLMVCQKIDEDGKHETAHRVNSLWGQIARYGIASQRCVRDVSHDITDALTPVVNQSMDSIHNHALLGQLLRAIEEYVTPHTARLVMFQAYTFVRPTEARHIEWSEIDFDNAKWEIPATKIKKKYPHIVPLSRQAISIIKSLQRRGKYVFESVEKPPACMSSMTMTMALRRVCRITGLPHMVPHGWRSAASTILNEYQWPADAIERQLAHKPKGVRAAYNFAQYLPIRRTMMQWWADFLDAMKTGTRPPEVEYRKELMLSLGLTI